MSRIFVKNLPKNATEQQLKQFFSAKGEVTDVKLLKESDGTFRRVAFIGFREKGISESLTKYFDKNYIGTCKIQVEEAKPQSDPSLKVWSKKPKQKPAKNEPQKEEEKTIEESTENSDNKNLEIDPSRLFLRNLSYGVSKEDIEDLFSQFGAIEEVTLPIDAENHRPKGFAYVKFAATESAVQAFDKLDRSVFQGRLLHIIQAKKKPEVIMESKAPSSYKKILAAKLKEKGKNSNTWNTLFLNPDSVASAMSNKLHMSKGEFMDTGADDLAVKISMAETKILQEIKEWMETQGINYEAFNGDRNNAARSQNVIIVKNLPGSSALSDIQDIFSRYGALGRCCMPPSKTMAIVEYLDSSAAENAFQQASYLNYKSLPIYLEWAPLNTFDSEYIKPIEITKASTNTLFVKNLSFETTRQTLEDHMKQCGTIKSIRIVTNKGLPCGYGFVEYSTEKSASKALRNLNNSLLDGHALKLSEAKTTIQIPQKRPRIEEETKEIDTRIKLLVKNLAFEATKEELKNLFQNFGEVKNVRIPSKAQGTHRGFAFVEFLTHDDAENAMNSLQNTHLYGRRLVLEWAQTEETMSSIRKKQQV